MHCLFAFSKYFFFEELFLFKITLCPHRFCLGNNSKIDQEVRINRDKSLNKSEACIYKLCVYKGC